MTEPPTVYLASQSPRRGQLLAQIGVRFALLPPGEDEDVEALERVLPGEGADAYVRRVTRAKLAAARQRLARRGLPPAPILTADTTVVIGRTILGKPVDAADASGMLARLSGRSHRVITGVSVWSGRQALGAVSVSRVRFAPLSPATIAAYVASSEPFGKAGGYAIQGVLAGWIAHLEGSYSGVMGLPLFETAQLLRRSGVPLALAA